jgi:CelD/BcsL family acetyltransferase involved in cellulose biosynthesis
VGNISAKLKSSLKCVEEIKTTDNSAQLNLALVFEVNYKKCKKKKKRKKMSTDESKISKIKH